MRLMLAQGSGSIVNVSHVTVNLLVCWGASNKLGRASMRLKGLNKFGPPLEAARQGGTH